MFADQQTGDVTRLDLEDPSDLARLEEPKLALQDLQGLVMIDEIQRAPRLFEILRVLVDRESNRARFLILGSASRDLIRQSSESLAGRIGYIELTPFQMGEVGAENATTLWVQAELDLLLVQGDRKTGYEVKYTSRPAVTRSMRTAMQDLKLERLVVVYRARSASRWRPTWRQSGWVS